MTMRRFFVTTAVMLALGAGLFAWRNHATATTDRVVRVNANLYRIYTKGHFEEMPLMALADHACASADGYFSRYCE